MRPVWRTAFAITSLTISTAMAFAREEIAHIEGTVFLDGQQLETSSQPVLYENSIVRTEDGRVEIRLASSDLLFLGAQGSIKAKWQSWPQLEPLRDSSWFCRRHNRAFRPRGRLRRGRTTLGFRYLSI